MSGAESPLPEELEAVADLEAAGFEFETGRWGWGFCHLNDQALRHVKRLRTIPFLDLFEVCDSGGVTDDGLANLAGNTSLLCLRLGPGITDAGLAHLAGLTQLIELRLDSAAEITDAGMKHVRGLINLECLSVQYTQVGDSGIVELSTLSNLRELNIYHTNITDDCLMCLSRLAELSSLVLSKSAVSEKAIRAFQSALPTCKVEMYE